MCSADLQTYLTKVASYTERIPVYVLKSVPAMGSLISMSPSGLKRLDQVLYVNGKPVCVRLDGPHGLDAGRRRVATRSVHCALLSSLVHNHTAIMYVSQDNSMIV